jgi:ubiquinone/menaquinone biosynthesis C-methylase UbiE
VKDYQHLFEEISRTLRPGGLVEFAEVDWYTYDRNFRRIDVSLDEAISPPYWARFFAHVRSAIKHSGGDSDAATYLWQWVSRHPAFERINSRDVWLPAIPGDDQQYSAAAYELMKKDVQVRFNPHSIAGPS